MAIITLPVIGTSRYASLGWCRHGLPPTRARWETRRLAQQFLYVGEGNQIVIVNRKTLAVLANDRFGAPGTVRPHQMAIDSKGNVYTAELDYGTQRFAVKGVSNQKR